MSLDYHEGSRVRLNMSGADIWDGLLTGKMFIRPEYRYVGKMGTVVGREEAKTVAGEIINAYVVEFEVETLVGPFKEKIRVAGENLVPSE